MRHGHLRRIAALSLLIIGLPVAATRHAPLPFATPSAAAATLRVPGDHHTIQNALASAQPGDTVAVAPGIYAGPGNRDLTFGGKGVALIGAGVSDTIIDCEGKGRGFVFRDREDGATLVRGFSVMDAAALGTGAAGKGAGLYCGGAAPRIESCIFMMSEAWYGGGLAAEGDAHPVLVSCLFMDNVARIDGGGLYLLGGGGDLRDCRLAGNSAAGRGPDAYLFAADVIFDDCRMETPPETAMIRLDTSR